MILLFSFIFECAIVTLAEVGYSQASLGQIAKRAKISKGVVSYYFSNKEELLKEVIAKYYSKCRSTICPQIEAETSPKRHAMMVFITESVQRFLV